MCLCEAGQIAAPLVLERGASGDLDPAEENTADDPDQDGIEEGNTALVRVARGALAARAEGGGVDADQSADMVLRGLLPRCVALGRWFSQCRR